MAVSPLRVLIRRTFLHGNFVRKRYRYLSERLQVICQPLAIPSSASPCYCYCTQGTFRNDVSVYYRDGLPVLSVPLPSRREICEFTLKPISHTVGDFVQFILDEDHGIDRVSIYKQDGTRVARSTPIEILLRSNFKIIINNEEYFVAPPDIRPLLNEDAETLSDVKHLVSVLYSTLQIEDYQLQQERDLRRRLEDLNEQIAPFEQLKQQIEEKASRNANYLSWLGLGLMGLQFGILARLTWWEYSWDIMEPVTYFVTYGTSMAMFSYYLLTKQEYTFPDARDRQFLVRFYKLAHKKRLNVDHYNQLRDAIHKAEEDLRRLQDPLQLHLPIKEIQKRSADNQ